jgi:hypothetical protein
MDGDKKRKQVPACIKDAVLCCVWNDSAVWLLDISHPHVNIQCQISYGNAG